MSEKVELTEAEQARAVMQEDITPYGKTRWYLHADVERILTDRLAAVQADYERRLDHAHDESLILRSRAESAEAERDAALAALEALRDRVDKIARNPYARDVADMLRAAVEGGSDG